jgi:hypothetical protein
MSWEDDVATAVTRASKGLLEASEGLDDLAKLVLKAPRRTPAPPTGHITDIFVNPAAPKITSDIANGALIANLSAIDNIDAVTFTKLSGAECTVTGSQVLRNVAGGALTPGTPISCLVKASDSRGDAGSYSELIVIDVWDHPSSIVLGTIGQPVSIAESIAAGTIVGPLSASGGKAPYASFDVTSGVKFDAELIGGNWYLTRTASGTLTAGVTETPEVTVTDANGATYAQNISVQVTASASSSAGFTEDIEAPAWSQVYLDYVGAPNIGSESSGLQDGGAANIWASSSTDLPAFNSLTFNGLALFYDQACRIGSNIKVTIRTGTAKAYLKLGRTIFDPPVGYAPVSMYMDHNLGSTAQGTTASGVTLRPEQNFYLKGTSLNANGKGAFEFNDGTCTAHFYFVGFNFDNFPGDIVNVPLNGASVPVFVQNGWSHIVGVSLQGPELQELPLCSGWLGWRVHLEHVSIRACRGGGLRPRVRLRVVSQRARRHAHPRPILPWPQPFIRRSCGA